MTAVYFRSHVRIVQVALAHGFADGPGGERRTVFDRPIRAVDGGRGSAMASITFADLDPASLDPFETTPPGAPWRSFEVPASILNGGEIRDEPLPLDDEEAELDEAFP